MTEKEWARICAKISRYWQQREMSADAFGEWFDKLADLPAAAVEQAVDTLALERQWPPSLADLRDAAEPDERSADEAAQDLRRLIARGGGAYRDTDRDGVPASRDPALDATIEAVGWGTLCNLDMTSASGWARFRDAYKSAQADLRRERWRAIAAGERPPPIAAALPPPGPPPDPADCPHDRVAVDRIASVCLDCGDGDHRDDPAEAVDPETARRQLQDAFAGRRAELEAGDE